MSVPPRPYAGPLYQLGPATRSSTPSPSMSPTAAPSAYCSMLRARVSKAGTTAPPASRTAASLPVSAADPSGSVAVPPFPPSTRPAAPPLPPEPAEPPAPPAPPLVPPAPPELVVPPVPAPLDPPPRLLAPPVAEELPPLPLEFPLAPPDDMSPGALPLDEQPKPTKNARPNASAHLSMGLPRSIK